MSQNNHMATNKKQHSIEKIVRAMQILADYMAALEGNPCHRPTRPRQGACLVLLLVGIHQVAPARLALLRPLIGAHCDAKRAETK